MRIVKFSHIAIFTSFVLSAYIIFNAARGRTSRRQATHGNRFYIDDFPDRVGCTIDERDCIASGKSVNTCGANRLACHNAIPGLGRARCSPSPRPRVVTKIREGVFHVDGMSLPSMDEGFAYRFACSRDEQDCIASGTSTKTCKANRMECYSAIARRRSPAGPRDNSETALHQGRT
ncbi:hypothetical protein M422DRAFT_44868 [Sphaerobolus stellatus SS14]|nr:hypothetical protein M422DRAFT_44868 [Sphaerobolus stellatus SS14]